MVTRDWEKYPELRNSEMPELLLQSPHKQIEEDFYAKCVEVHDGDTIRLKADFRDFDFRLRLLDIDTRELGEGGEQAKRWLTNMILNQEVQILIDRNNRVDKYGRLLGRIFYRGMNLGQEMIYLGLAKDFDARKEGKLPSMDEAMEAWRWQA